MMGIDSDLLKQKFQQAWDAVSSVSYEDTLHVEKSGICAIAALAVQKKYGGKILEADVPLLDGRTLSHVWNKLPDGTEIDLTRDQFHPGATVPEGEVMDQEHRGWPQHIETKRDEIAARL